MPLSSATLARFDASPSITNVFALNDLTLLVIREENEQSIVELWSVDGSSRQIWRDGPTINPMVAVAPAGHRLVLALGAEMHLFHIASGEHICSWGEKHPNVVMCRLRWEREERLFSLSTDNVVRMWNPMSGVCLSSWAMRVGQDFGVAEATSSDDSAIYTEQLVKDGHWMGRLIRSDSGELMREVTLGLSHGAFIVAQVAIRPGSLDLAAMLLMRQGDHLWSELHLWERGTHSLLGEYHCRAETDDRAPISSIQFVGPDLLHYCGWWNQGVWDVPARVDRLSIWKGMFSRSGLMLGAGGVLTDLSTGQRLQLGRPPIVHESISPSGNLVVLSQGEQLVCWRVTNDSLSRAV